MTTKSRDALVAAALDNGWKVIQADGLGVEFQRVITLDPSSVLQRLADQAGWELREKITATFSIAGAITAGFRMRPPHQAALTGDFVDREEASTPRRACLLAWLAEAPWNPNNTKESAA